jgi:hypothetical protein
MAYHAMSAPAVCFDIVVALPYNLNKLNSIYTELLSLVDLQTVILIVIEFIK